MSAAGGTDRKHGHGWGQQDWENGYVQPCGAQVRRLTPTECARLQGFPDDYLKIPVRKVNPTRLKSPRAEKDYRVVDGEVWQLAADGPQYKALGNSMAVPVMAWIGRRIEQALAGTVTLEDLL
jgi:DNA (cytosine-5)-methyltransferase 1